MKKKVLVAVFNTIEHDGRVRRATDSYSHLFAVTLLALHSNKPFHNDSYRLFRMKRHKSGIINLCMFYIYFIYLAIKVKPDIIHAHDYYLIFPGWLAARLTSARLVYDAHELIIPEANQSTTFRDYLFYALERMLIKSCDAIITANGDRGKVMKKAYGLTEIPTVIKNIPPRPVHFECKDFHRVISAHPELVNRENHKFLVVYQGFISYSRGLKKFLEAFRLLENNFCFYLIGDGDSVAEIKEDFKDLLAENKLVMLGKQNGLILNQLLALFDCGILTYPWTTLNNIFCAPNKIFEYALSNIPIVSTNQPPIKELLAYHRIGFSVHRRASNQEIAKTIKKTVKLKTQLVEEIPNFLKNHSWANEKSKLQTLLFRLS